MLINNGQANLGQSCRACHFRKVDLQLPARRPLGKRITACGGLQSAPPVRNFKKVASNIILVEVYKASTKLPNRRRSNSWARSNGFAGSAIPGGAAAESPEPATVSADTAGGSTGREPGTALAAVPA